MDWGCKAVLTALTVALPQRACSGGRRSVNIQHFHVRCPDHPDDPVLTCMVTAGTRLGRNG